MGAKNLNILAVGDPAVYVYVDRSNNFLEQFEREMGVRVNFNIVEWTKYYSTLLNSFQEYKYDIVMIAGHLWLKEFVSKDYLCKLNANFDEDYDYEDIMPVIRKEIELGNNKYLLPSFCDGHILLYRKSMIEQELADVVSITEVMEVVKSNSDNQKNTFILKAHPSEIFLDFLPYLRNEGEEAFNEQGLPLFNTTSAYTALDKYINMKNYCAHNVAEYGNEEVMKAIQRKKCKLGVSWGGQLGQIMNGDCLNPDDIAFSSLETSWNTTWSFAINHFCKNREIAERFLMFITSKKVDKAVGIYCGNPTRKSSFLAGQEEYRWYPILLKMMETAEPLPHLANTGQLINIVSKEIAKAFKNEISSEQALVQAYNKIINLR